jgi:hypothetical protein
MMMGNTVIRNWSIEGLTPDNRILKRVNGSVRETEERPSDFAGIEYLTRRERGILRRGLTPAGRDRERPK